MNAAQTSLALVAVLTLSAAAQAQGPSAAPTAVPPAASGGLASHHHASTVPESVLRGEADLVRAFGEADYNHSAAWLIREGAYSALLDNKLKYTQTFFQMRAINAEARAIERGVPPCAESLARYNRQRTPCRPASHELDPVTATIQWPVALQCKCYDAFRQRLDQLFAERSPQNSGVGSKNYRDVQALVCTMRHLLRQQVHELDSAEYRHARKFIDSLGYESRHRITPEQVAAGGHPPVGAGAPAGAPGAGPTGQAPAAEGVVIAEDVAAAVGQALGEGAAAAPIVENAPAKEAIAADEIVVAEGAPVLPNAPVVGR